MTKQEKAAYQREWYAANLEKCREQRLISYHKNKHKYLERKKINNANRYVPKLKIAKVVVPVTKKEIVIVEKVKRNFTMTEIMTTLRKDMKHELWKKSIKQWNIIDWIKFNEI